LKLGYFLSLVEQISPLIDIIYRIVYDIGWFVLILFALSFAYVYAFYIIAQNQLNFDNIQDAKTNIIPYDSLYASSFYIWELINGNTNNKMFVYGDGS